MDVRYYTELWNTNFVALITPMHINDKINFSGLEQLIEHTYPYVHGYVVNGTTGNECSLDIKEKLQVLNFVNKVAGQDKFIISGDGSSSTKEAVDYLKTVEKKIGVYTHLQLSPPRANPTQEGIYQHYKKCSDAIDGRLILYSFPERTGGEGISLQTIERLSELDNIIGIKDGNIDRIKKIFNLTKDKEFTVLCGNDKSVYEAINYCKNRIGVCSGGVNNIIPDAFNEMIVASGRLDQLDYVERAKSIQENLNNLYSAFDLEPNPIGIIHYALELIGISAGVPRLPLIEPKDKIKEKIENVLVKLDLIE